ncbi:MAG: Wzz/FepE/Etk N-terminal domain-containing protein [Pseudobdellovibrionaceae bacterium]|nr:Wzz/FepE/Etk N-terminal domain-containing protein [Pseudobdellovibrionaceae bacterium]
MSHSSHKRIYSLADFVTYLWCARVSLAVGFLVGCLVACVLLFVLKPQYEARMIVAPPRQGAEALNFLAEDVPPVLSPSSAQAVSQDGEYIRFQQSLRGPAVAAVLLKMDGTLAGVNRSSRFIGGSGQVQGAVDLSEHLVRAVQIDPIGDTGSVRLVYTHPDPAFAERILGNLVRISDQLIRMDVRRDVEARIEWLKREMKATLHPEHRKSLTRLLMAEERRRMLLSIETPYALSIIEDANVSPRPVSPRAVILFPVLGILGFILGLLFFTIRQELNDYQDNL